MEMTWIETLRLLGLDLLALLLLALIGRLRRARGRTHDAAPGTTAHRLSLRKPPSRHARVERATCRGTSPPRAEICGKPTGTPRGSEPAPC
jgi:hypothetical protein